MNIINHKPKITPKEFFIQLGVTIALYTVAISLATLLFGLINNYFPLSRPYYYDAFGSGIKASLSALIISFIVYIALSWLSQKTDESGEEKMSPVRRWMAYVTLFVTGAALAIDLITLLNYFLDGEYTARFLLKVLVVLIIAGKIFSYYLYDLRKGLPLKWRRSSAVAFGITVLVVIIWSFAVIGSPVKQREIKQDYQRTNDLSGIQSQVAFYWQRKGKLPQNLDEMRDPISSYMVPNDPETNMPYEYQVKGDKSFTLCATFAHPTQDNLQRNGYMTAPVMIDHYEGSIARENWVHGAGRTCFDRTIDPELYPPASKTRLQ